MASIRSCAIVIVCSPIRPPGARCSSRAAEVAVPVTLANRLELLDRADRVEPAVEAGQAGAWPVATMCDGLAGMARPGSRLTANALVPW